VDIESRELRALPMSKGVVFTEKDFYELVQKIQDAGDR
jgi:hypothetical protein